MTGEAIQFIKLHGLGNDYIFVDLFEKGELPWDPTALSREVSDRHFGVGGDGLILVFPGEDAPFRMRMFNADGSEGEMCGNGMRCFAKYVFEQGYTAEEEFSVETGAGVIRPRVFPTADGVVSRVQVDMGRPRLSREKIPVNVPGDRGSPVVNESLSVDGREIVFTAVSMGNPHCVVFTDDVEGVDLAELGPRIETHQAFPKRTNVELVQVAGPGEAVMRVWERGSGVTMACGTGACAVVVAGAISGRTGRKVKVRLAAGELDIHWAEDDGHVYMTGPVVEVFRGVYQPR